MLPQPTDNRRPALLLSSLTAVTVVVVALTTTFWLRYRAEDRSYYTELRRAVRKYRTPEAVPPDSREWLARVHGRSREEVLTDLEVTWNQPATFDPDAPLHPEMSGPVRLYLDLGFFRFWAGLSCVGILATVPLVVLGSRPGRRRPPRPELERGFEDDLSSSRIRFPD